jgi:hypothetical protein
MRERSEIATKNRGIMRAAIFVALGSSLAAAAAACSSSSNEWSSCFCDNPDGDTVIPDSGQPYFGDGSALSPSYATLRLENDLCFPNPLPIDAGLVDCHVVVFVYGATSCVSFGLTTASAVDSTYLTDFSAANGVPLPSGDFCALDQLPADACLVDASAGWCYVPGGCEPDAGCAQSLCASNGYAPDGGVETWLVCP